jgi:hypothetical protein
MTALPAELSPGDDTWRQLLADQHGVMHRSDVHPDFFRDVMTALRRGRWNRISRDVFVNHNGPLTTDQQLWAVIKAAPPGSALSGLTAARLGGLLGFDPDGTFVTVPCATAMPKLNIAPPLVHYSRYLDTRDVHPLLVPRRTRPARSLLDAAAWAETDTRARSVLLAGVQQRLVTPDHLHEALPRRGPCLRHALIVETIADAKGGITSVPEQQFERIRRRYGLPAPTRQRVLRRATGRYYLDVDWEAYDLASEIDGMPHMSILNWDADLDRMNEIAIQHRTLLRFTSYAVRHRPEEVGRTLTRALLSRGWH